MIDWDQMAWLVRGPEPEAVLSIREPLYAKQARPGCLNATFVFASPKRFSLWKQWPYQLICYLTLWSFRSYQITADQCFVLWLATKLHNDVQNPPPHRIQCINPSRHTNLCEWILPLQAISLWIGSVWSFGVWSSARGAIWQSHLHGCGCTKKVGSKMQL